MLIFYPLHMDRRENRKTDGQKVMHMSPLTTDPGFGETDHGVFERYQKEPQICPFHQNPG